MSQLASRIRAAIERRLGQFLNWIDAQMTFPDRDFSRPEDLKGAIARLDSEVTAFEERVSAEARRSRPVLLSLADLDADIARLDRQVADRVRADVEAAIGQGSAGQSERLMRTLALLEREAKSLRALAEQEEHGAIAMMNRCEAAVRRNDDEGAVKALASHGAHLAIAQQFNADAEQLEWLVGTYAEALATTGPAGAQAAPPR